MIDLKLFANKKIAILGLGKSGLASAKALARSKVEIICWDDNAEARERAHSLGFKLQDLHEINWTDFSYLVVAPGIGLYGSLKHWAVDLANLHNVPIIGDIELFMLAREAFLLENNLSSLDLPVIGVTGTNGKSTTTALIGHLLRSFGYQANMGGNIGWPILEMPNFAKGNFYVLELSSYQLDLSPSLKLDRGVLLNLSPDHIDRHGSFDRYVEAKVKLITNSDVALLAVDDSSTYRLASEFHEQNLPLILATIIKYNDDLPCDLPLSYKLVDQVIYKSNPGDIAENQQQDWQALVDTKSLENLRGQHNRQNIIMALAAIEPWLPAAPAYDKQAIYQALESFVGLPHRLETVAIKHNILFINDSKATNAQAALPALNSFSKVYWILGGIPKEGGIDILEPLFPKVIKAYIIGQAQAQFIASFKNKVPYLACENLEIALDSAVQDIKAAGGDSQQVILFSPACASFDQFANYEQRGMVFKQLVEAYL